MNRNETGVFNQTWTLFLRDGELFLNNVTKILSTFGFPILIGLLIVGVSKDTFFKDYEGTKSALFTIVCAGIYVGMFNSLTIIVKERKIIKREYMTNMRLLSYVLAQTLFQAIICAIQSMLFMAVYWHFIDFPDEGLAFSNTFWEYFITLFLIMFTSDLLGMVISATVKSSEMANLIAPIIIIIQLVLSGVLFTLEGNVQNVAKVTVSKWGMEAMGSISRLNDQPLKLQEAFPQIPHDAEEIYNATRDHLIQSWEVLGIFIIVLVIVCVVMLKGVERDTR